MRKRAAAALMAWILMQATPAAAQDWLRSYGGSGRDSLREIVSVGDGILAAGSTTSSDGDLSIRTREGKTGWLLRLGADGSVLWNFCSSRDGKAEICSPFVHDNGCVSCVLTGERGQEWIELNERGRAEKRVAVPDVSQLCRHERQEDGTSVYAVPHDREGQPFLALVVDHGDGTCCIAELAQDGKLSPGMSFVKAEADLFAACRDGSGRIAMPYADEASGALGVCFIQPGTDELPTVAQANLGEWLSDGVLLDCAALEDGSIILSGQKKQIGGVLVRINALGETVFAHSMDDIVTKLTVTSGGFAGYYRQGVAYFDEDGGLLGTKEAEYPTDERNVRFPMGIAAFGNGVAALFEPEEGEAEECRIRVISGENLDEDCEYENALFVQKDCTLLNARANQSGVTLLLERRDGQRFGVQIDRGGTARETEIFPERIAGRQTVDAGTLTWQETEGGAWVALEDEQGNVRWRTRTVIHTAADRLEWLCAVQLPDGSYALGGRCLTDTEDGEQQEAVLCIIGNDAVLRRISTVQLQEGRSAGCVCDMLVHPQKGLLMLTSSGAWTHSGANQIQSADGSVHLPLEIGFEADGARLLTDESGEIYVAGTDEENGQRITALVRVDLQTGKATL